jgi:transcriptional regulator with XRE-family HTH domain
MKGQYVMGQESNRQRFAARLTALREALGLSRADVGAAVGVSGEAIRTWEQGAYAPRKKATVSKLEEALGARPGELWALLKGYEIPAKHPRRPDADTDPNVLREVLEQMRALQAQIDELRQEPENGEPHAARRGSSPREPVRQAS